MGLSPAAVLEELQRFPPAETYWVAFSGGCDSLALLHALVELGVRLPARLRALLRAPEEMRWRMPPFPGDDADAEALVAYLSSLEIARDVRFNIKQRMPDWFALHAATMDSALAMHLKNIGFDVATA